MGDIKLLESEALRAHRAFLQEVLAEVMPILSSGTASDERLIMGLDAYWDACFSRRGVRRAVLAATRSSALEPVVEPMGKPFEVMVRAELMPTHGARAAALATVIYDTARAIAVDESVSGERATLRRKALIARIRAAREVGADLKAA